MKFRQFNGEIKESYDDMTTTVDGKPAKVWVNMYLREAKNGSLKDFDAGDGNGSDQG